MKYLFMTVFILSLLACSGPSVPRSVSPGPQARLLSPVLYVVPFDTIMVPEEVSALVFNRFVDRLNQAGAGQGHDFVILKQGIRQIDPAWLAEREYLVGEIYAYVEDVGSTVTDIKARSRVRLYQPGQSKATLELTLPVETFYENDYSALSVERSKLAEKISTELADQLLRALFGG
ncbi:MAG TPA: hypothetical protein VIR78_10225 [Malonomonas sp.]